MSFKHTTIHKRKSSLPGDFFFGGGRGSVGRPILQVVQAEQPFLVDFFGSGTHRFGSFFSSPSNGKDMTCSS